MTRPVVALTLTKCHTFQDNVDSMAIKSPTDRKSKHQRLQQHSPINVNPNSSIACDTFSLRLNILQINRRNSRTNCALLPERFSYLACTLIGHHLLIECNITVVSCINRRLIMLCDVIRRACQGAVQIAERRNFRRTHVACWPDDCRLQVIESSCMYA